MTSLCLSSTRTTLATATFAAFLSFTALSSSAHAASDIFAPGQPVLTGFPGVIALDEIPDGADPLDYTFIDPDGHSLAIQDLLPDAAPEGQLIETPDVFGVTAADVGLVFGVTLDDAPETTGADAPNIYLSATSAYGIYLSMPDADGNPVRTRTGDPSADYMEGQWGSAGGATGYPGSIWKVDGETGEVSLFSTIAANSGPGLGDIAFDSSSQQFFVSDLDTGLIYRLALDGTILDTFDHGMTARPEHDLDPVEDDGLMMDIADPSFNSEDPSTWGATQPERRVYGLAAHNGRIYYAVRDALSVWSVRLNDDGSFGAARWEFDVTDLPSTNDITSIVFDPQGRMILAQRGDTVGSYDYSVLAEAGSSSVVRYKREFPDDPATPSTWVEVPDSYSIGLASDGLAASGGLALGNGFEDDTGAFTGACGVYVWATGDQLRTNPDLDPPVEGPTAVSGLQGTLKTLVRPLNDPATNSFFTDFNANTDDETSTEAGHVGKVAIWQDCSTPTAPDVEPPDFVMPPDFDIDYDTDEFNLTLEKWSAPHTCFDGATDYWCTFTIRVENTGTTAYWGPVTVHDSLPANPAGATMSFWPGAQWACGPAGPAAYTCNTAPVLLFPGDAVTLHEVVKLPKPTAAGFCNLLNVAGIQWPFLFHDENPGDDFDGAVAHVPAPGCVPPGVGVTDLSINKFAAGANCFDPGGGADYLCTYGILVTNAGPNNYSGPIQVKDTLGINVSASVLFGGWTCGQAGPVLTCNINAAPVNVPPGWSSVFFIQAKMPKPVAPPACDLTNKAQISIPAGGAPNNILPGNDFDTAVTHVLSPACLLPTPDTDLEVKKTADTCGWFLAYYCKWTLTFKNVGTNNYWGPLTFTDQSIGAVGNNLNTVIGGGCSGPASNLTCDYPLVGLPAGVPVPFTFYTWYTTTPTLCSASNSATIDNPNPGSVQNPAGNDSVTVGHAIPNPACAGLPNVNITKTAKGCVDDPGSTDWLCKFDIKVKNFGPVAQPGPIVVRDINLKPTTFNTAACGPFAANVWQCTRAAALGPGATWSFQATTHVDPNGVTLADCNVLNTAVIITPPSIANPGHWSQDSQKVPQLFVNLGPGPVYVYCDPPSLKLEKTATKTVTSGDGYDATFRIKATSTGPDPYHGTVEIDEDLPEGTTYVSSSWPCVPTDDNNVHCSSPYKDLPVGTYTTMTITIHVPGDVAKEQKCDIVNVANIALSAEVLHSDEGVQYTASASAKLPANACQERPQCPINQVMPDGGCCPAGEVWNGKQCAPPKPVCPDDSHLNSAGKCVCDQGTTGKPGSCEKEPVAPTCPDDSHLNNAGKCVCDRGTEGKPGNCKPIDVTPTCPDDSHLNNAGKCVCDQGTEGKPGNCQPVAPICPDDSHLNNAGKCVCDRGTEGKPGNCQPIAPSCPDDSHLNNAGQCVCDRGTEGKPGNCQPIIIVPICPDDSVLSTSGQCVCKRGTSGKPGNCQAPEPEKPIQTQCPDDSFFNKRTGQCQCNKGTVGKPGNCQIELVLDLPVIKLN